LLINLKVNNFAKILIVQRFNKVNYYSVKLEEENMSLFGQFIEKHTKENKDKLNHILAWIKIIGDKYSAKANYFRNEAETADTSALPPENPNWEPTYIEWNNEKQTRTTNNLRLYTFRANDQVVFLFNGDVKTADKAQNCPNVWSHFRLANEITEAIEQCFRSGEIKWNSEHNDIEFLKDLELNW
jgi:hypothetical protein